ncbi:unnamed protein product [Fusarium graminearum]|nr:unnamed protein product [Fusarium graminearum]CAG1985636.1 unnamed protein product [Fusarium graminearum]
MTSYDSDSRVGICCTWINYPGTSTKQKTWQPTRTVTYRTTPQTIARFSGIDHRNSWIIARVVAFSSQFVSPVFQGPSFQFSSSHIAHLDSSCFLPHPPFRAPFSIIARLARLLLQAQSKNLPF